MSKRVRVSISLSPEDHQKLSEWAEEEGRTISNLAWFLVTTHLKERDEAKNPPKRGNQEH
jgi:hypothetical protein